MHTTKTNDPQSKKTELLRDLREALDHHQQEYERASRHLRVDDRMSNTFDLRLECMMHERFSKAITQAIETIE